MRLPNKPLNGTPEATARWRQRSAANLKYFGATWNSPFALYYSDHCYRGFGKSYDLKGANGVTVKVEASSDGKRVIKAAD